MSSFYASFFIFAVLLLCDYYYYYYYPSFPNVYGRNVLILLVFFFSVRRMLRGVSMMLPVIPILVSAVTLMKKELGS